MAIALVMLPLLLTQHGRLDLATIRLHLLCITLTFIHLNGEDHLLGEDTVVAMEQEVLPCSNDDIKYS